MNTSFWVAVATVPKNPDGHIGLISYTVFKVLNHGKCHITMENVTLSFDIENTSETERKRTNSDTVHQHI